MIEAKSKGCKKLTFRKDLHTDTAIKYFTPNYRFFVDTDNVFYDYQNTPMYKARLSYGKEGYVAVKGVDLIVKSARRKYPTYHKKAKSGK